jgi:hypothetical protein
VGIDTSDAAIATQHESDDGLGAEQAHRHMHRLRLSRALVREKVGRSHNLRPLPRAHMRTRDTQNTESPLVVWSSPQSRFLAAHRLRIKRANFGSPADGRKVAHTL